jgi:16S rRNA (guanine527-N7)-methyltransferase
MARLDAYLSVLNHWHKAINLVSKDSLRDPWRRHFWDSAQLLPLIPPASESVVDLGSGAGFPGAVLSILGVSSVHLIESDGRKCAFLREVSRVTGAEFAVHQRRIDDVIPWQAGVVTARALAPLAVLLGYAGRFLGPQSIGLFLKGGGVDRELTAAAKGWNMTAERIASRSSPTGTILRLSEVRRK